MKELESKLIHAFSRNETEKIQTHVRKYKGNLYIDIRIWFQTESDPTYRPTKKGLSFKFEQLREFHQGVERLVKAQNNFEENEQNHDQ